MHAHQVALAASGVQRYLVGTAPAGRSAPLGIPPTQTVHLIALVHIYIRSHRPGLHLLPIGTPLLLHLSKPVVVEQLLAGLRPLTNVDHCLTSTIFHNQVPHLFVAKRVGHTLQDTRLAIAPYPGNRATTHDFAEEMWEQFAVLHATQQLAPGADLSAVAIHVHALCRRSAERVVLQPAAITLNGHEGSNHIAGTQPAHTRRSLPALDKFCLALQPRVATLMEPSGILAAVEVGKGSVDALMHTGVLLRDGIIDIHFAIAVVGEGGIEASYGIIRNVDHRPRRPLVVCSTLPTTQLCVVVVAVDAASHDVHRTEVAVAGTLVGWPAEFIAEESEVFVHLLQQILDGEVGDVLVLRTRATPSASPPLSFHVAGHAHAFGQHAFRRRVEFRILPTEVVVQRRIVGVVFPTVRHRGVEHLVLQGSHPTALALILCHVGSSQTSHHCGGLCRRTVGKRPVPDGIFLLTAGQCHLRGQQGRILLVEGSRRLVGEHSGLTALAQIAEQLQLAKSTCLVALHVDAQPVAALLHWSG